jgi:autotransporter-associated beta strand protein
MKNLTHNSLRFIPTTLGLVFFLLANHAGAQQGWDPNGTTSVGGNGTWDANTLNWTPNGTQTQVASGSLVPWTSGDIALFCAGPGASTSQGGPWTVTVNGAITVGGIVNGLDNPGSCYITLANGTSGSLHLAGAATFSSAGTAQGANVINVPITGTGPLTTYGQWGTTLGVANSFTSGCNIDGTGGVSFGNNAAFGTGAITWQAAGFIEPADTSAYTIANAMTHGALIETFGGNSGGVTFSGNWTLPASGTTTIENYNTGGYAITVAGVISGAAALTINTNTANFHNLWIFTKANTYGGATTIAAGTLQQGAANVIPNGSGKGNLAVSSGATLDLGGFNCSVNGFGTSAGTIDNATGAGTPALTIGTTSGSSTHSGPIKNTTGTLAVTKVGASTVILSGTASTYSGITTVNGGYLYINADGSLGAAPSSPVANQLTLNCGTLSQGLRFNANNVTLNANRGIYLGPNGGSINCPTGDKATIQGVISGPGNFQSGGNDTTGTGTNVISGANTYSGTTAIAAGRLLLGASGALPSGTPLTIGADNASGSILDLGGYSQTIGPLSSSTGIGGTPSPAGTPTIVLSGALAIQETSSSTFAGSIIDGATIGSLTISGPAALTLSGVNTYSGATTISSGELLGATGGSCANSTVTVSDGATNGVSITDNTKQWTCGSVTYNSGAPALDFNFGYTVTPSTFTAPLNVNGDVTFNGTPSVTVEAANLPPGTYPLMTWSGSQLGSAPAPTMATLPPHVTGTLGVSGNTLNLTVTGNTQPIRWTGAAGNSLWDINTSQNWKDSSGSATDYLQTTLPGDAVIFDETYISASQNITLNTVVTPASMTVNNSTWDYTIGGSGGIAGSTSLLKEGTAKLTFNFANSYTGGTTIAGGTLSIGTDLDLGAVPASTTPASIVLNNGALSANTTLTLNANRGITMQANSTMDVASGQTLTYTGIIAGPSWNLTKTGPGTLVLGGNHNSYSGNTIISAGILQTGGDNGTAGNSNLGHVPSSPAPNNITLAGGTLQGNNPNFAFYNTRGVTLTADSGLSALTNCMMGIQGPIIGNYGLTISSPIGSVGTNGVVYLEGTNTYTGNTVITYGGILSLYYSGSISNSASISIAAGAGFDVSNYTNDVGAKTFFLVSGQTLIASGTGTTTNIGIANAAVLNGPASGTVSLNSQPITLNYTPTSFTGDATHSSLYVPQGTLALNGNAFTVKNMAGSPLGGGTYVLIQQANGNISSAGSYAVNVTGTGLAAGATASISVSGGSVNLVVVAPVVSRPGINSVTLSGANLIFSGTNGPDNGTFHVLSSTNVALPLSNWTSIANGTFSPTGAFSVTNAVGGNPSRFFVIQIP